MTSSFRSAHLTRAAARLFALTSTILGADVSSVKSYHKTSSESVMGQPNTEACHLNKFSLSQERWINPIRKLWETVSNAFRDVHCHGDRLPYATTLAEKGNRAYVVEYLGLKPCWETRVSKVFTIAGKISRSSFVAAKHNREIWAALFALLSKLLWWGEFYKCQLQ